MRDLTPVRDKALRFAISFRIPVFDGMKAGSGVQFVMPTKAGIQGCPKKRKISTENSIASSRQSATPKAVEKNTSRRIKTEDALLSQNEH